VVGTIEADTPIRRARLEHGEKLMVLMTTRSHDRYNTSVHGLNDRYWGVFGQRVVLVHLDDLRMLVSRPASGST